MAAREKIALSRLTWHSREVVVLCANFATQWYKNHKRRAITIKDSLNLLTILKKSGSEMFLSFLTEKPLSPAYVPFAEHAGNMGIELGMPNAWDWGPEKVDRVRPICLG